MFDLPIPNGWQLVTLSELGEVNRGRSRHRPRDAEHLYGGPYPFIQTGDVKASSGRITNYTQTYSEEGLKQSRLWPAGTMCITIAANIAETGILSFPACFPDSVIGFIADDKKCNPFFIEYVFRLLRRHIQAQATGSVQDNINLQTLERLHFPVPVLNEQNRIANILCAFDEKIQLNRQINQTLEQMAQAIFQSWFVDFEPVKAKISAREDWLARQAVQRDAHDDAPQFSSPVCYAHEFADAAAPAPATQADLETFMNRAAMCAISGKTDADLDAMPAADYQRLYHTASLFPDELIESELGEIPKGWEVVKIEDVIVRLSVGKKFSQKTVSPEGNVPVLDQGKSGVIGFHNEAPGVNASVKEPVIVFANHTCYMRLIMYPFSAIQNVLPFIGGDLNTLWLYFATQGKQEFVEYKGHWPDFVIKQIVKPDSRLAEIFSEKIMASMELIYKNELQSEGLTKLRDSLLPKLLSGELDISALTDLAENAAEPGADHV